MKRCLTIVPVAIVSNECISEDEEPLAEVNLVLDPLLNEMRNVRATKAITIATTDTVLLLLSRELASFALLALLDNRALASSAR